MSQFTNTKKLFTFIAMLFLGFTLAGCSNPEQEKCLEQASQLWDNKTNDKNANQAYWTAVERCKETYK